MTSSMQTQVGFLKFNHELATARVALWDDGTGFISGVYSRSRGKGHGTRVMQDIIDYADKYNLKLQLDVQRYGDPHGGKDNQELEDWYASFGFKVVPDTGRPVRMERLPNEFWN